LISVLCLATTNQPVIYFKNNDEWHGADIKQKKKITQARSDGAAKEQGGKAKKESSSKQQRERA